MNRTSNFEYIVIRKGQEHPNGLIFFMKMFVEDPEKLLIKTSIILSHGLICTVNILCGYPNSNFAQNRLCYKNNFFLLECFYCS